MKRKDIVILIVLLVVFVGVFYLRQKARSSEQIRVPESLFTEKQFEDKFKIQIPDDVDKVELFDLSGGNSSGIATKSFKDGKFEASVLADLPEPSAGEFYQAWLAGDGENVSLGKMKSAKGGWMVEFESKKDYSSLNTFMVTSEKKFDLTPETKVLEGNLKQ
jgi:hypothetical protein